MFCENWTFLRPKIDSPIRSELKIRPRVFAMAERGVTIRVIEKEPREGSREILVASSIYRFFYVDNLKRAENNYASANYYSVKITFPILSDVEIEYENAWN